MEQIVAGIARTSFPDRTITVTPAPDIDALPMLQYAIDSCSLLGGGRVDVAAGEYLLCGSLHLKSNVNLHLQEGAYLRFSGKADDFMPMVLTRFEGTELYGRSPMVYAYHQQNIAITGRGVIDGQAGVEMGWWGWDPAAHETGTALHGTPGELPEKPFVARLRQMGEDLTPVNERVFAEGTKLRPTCVETFGCSRVLIEGITIKDSPFWTIHPLYCDNVIRPSERIVIRRCDFQSECNGLCIGSEMSGGVQGVWMDSIRIGTVKNALYFKSNKDRGGFIRDVHVSNVTIEKAFGAILRFETNYFGYHGGNYQAQYEDFDISHITAGEAESHAIFYDGNDEKPIRNIKVTDFHVIKALHPWYLYRTEDCSFVDCTVNGEPVPEYPAESTERQTCDVW